MDTAGNIIETFKPCGFTEGCSYCRPVYFPPSVPATGGVPNYDDEEYNQDGIAEFFKNNFGNTLII